MNTFRRMTYLSLVAAALAFLAACQQATQPDAQAVQKAQQDVEALNNSFLKAFNAKDADALGALFTDDGMLMPSSAAVAKTPLAVTDSMRQLFSTGVSGMVLNTDEVTLLSDDSAVTNGYYTLLGAGGANVAGGNMLERLIQMQAQLLAPAATQSVTA